MATVNEKMTAIADAIRDKTGETDALSLDDMATDIPKVYEAGKKSQYDEFWDAIQYGDGEKSNRESYLGVFSGRGWNDDVFKPKYNIVPISAYCMFASDKTYSYTGGIQNLVGCLENAGIQLDFSKCTNFQMTWFHSIVTHIGVVDTTSASNISQTFYFAKFLHTIDKLILKDDGSQGFPYAPFSNCLALENITIAGKIGVSVGFDQSSKLTYESLTSIINALKILDSTTATLTLHEDAKARLSESDIATITQKGWTLA